MIMKLQNSLTRYSFTVALGAAALFAPAMARADTANLEPEKNPDHAASFDAEHMFETVSDVELSDQRGGFVVGGMDIRLGAEMRTYLNGDLVLSTIVNWDSAGATTTQIFSDKLTPAYRTALGSGFSTGEGMAVKLDNTPVFLANQGQTALVQNANGAIQNMVFNVANNINLIQQTDVSIDVTGYEGLRGNILSNRVSDALGASMGAVTLGALGR
jgi:hypothetical protein